MNILLSIHHSLDYSSGAPGVTMKLADALGERGHSVKLISFDNLGWLRGKPRAMAFPWAVFIHVLRHPEYDVLDLSSGDGWVVNLFRRAFGWRRRMLTVTRSHGLEHMGHELYVESCKDGHNTMSWRYPFYGGGYRLWECRQSFALADVSLMLNQSECEYVHNRFGVDTVRIVKFGNGIADCFVRSAKRLSDAATPSANRAINIAFTGRATFWKGFPYLSDAMVRILEHYPDSRLGLFGTGDSAQGVLDAFPEPLRARVAVVPRYEINDLPQLLSDFHIFAFPSLTEGFPAAPLEAMACGLVPVVADIAGTREYVHDGVNGRVVPARDAQALEHAIADLMNDPEGWLRLRDNALATASRYSWGDLAERIERFYCQQREHRSLART